MQMQRLGPYEFLGVLGRGGMGSVYRGKHEETGEIHAVKVLAHNFTHEAHFRNRFESEIKALIKLDHPNIVRILSYGQEHGNLFFAMELVEGNSLFQLQKKGHRFDWREILTIAKSVCKGLRHAHDRGIIHRDLKPGNLLMPIDESGQQGEVKITDFGIAKRFGAEQITGTNVLGTMDFMSPEQAKGQPVTIRSDLYSLGTVMFTLLSGKPPFTANSVEESLRNLTRVPAPHVSSVVPDVPRELDRLIQKLMSKRPESRIATAQALIYKIEEIEEKLRESSQAKTHELSVSPGSSDTFELELPNSGSTKANTAIPDKKRPTNDARFRSKTVEFTDDQVQLQPLSAAHEIDYFNTVTEKIRQIETALPEPERESTKGLVPLVLALIVVVGIAGYGIYLAYRPPSAEALFAEIESKVDQPNLVLDEMEQFLTLYPDDSRADEVAELEEIGKSIRHYQGLVNLLSVRSNIPGESKLTEIEKQFMEIVELADEDQRAARAKMAAFITVHKNSSDLAPRDQACLDAARGYFAKLKNDQETRLFQNLKKIRTAMASVDESAPAADRAQVYRSIIELFGDVDWGNGRDGQEGRDLLRNARILLRDAEREMETSASNSE